MAATVEGGALRTPLGDFRAPPSAEHGPAIVCIRPQHVVLRADGGGDGVRATVTGVTCIGDVTEVQLRVADLRLVARVADQAGFAVGDDSRVLVDPSHLFVFPQRDASTSAVA